MVSAIAAIVWFKSLSSCFSLASSLEVHQNPDGITHLDVQKNPYVGIFGQRHKFQQIGQCWHGFVRRSERAKRAEVLPVTVYDSFFDPEASCERTVLFPTTSTLVLRACHST